MSVRFDFSRQEDNYYRLLAKTQKNTKVCILEENDLSPSISIHSTTELIFYQKTIF